MFEDFSFPSPSSNDSLRVPGFGDDDGFLHCESTLVSPLSSRCPSPRLRPKDYSSRITKRSRSPFLLGSPPTSIPPSYVDQHRLSIGTLTRKLNAQSLEQQDPSSDSDDGRGCPLTPRSAYLEPGGPTWAADRKPSIGFISPQYGDKPYGHAPSYLDVSPTSTPRTSTDRRYSQPAPCIPSCTSTPHITSTPRQGSIEISQRRPSLGSLRSQREKLSILQCATMSVADTVRLAQILDEDERFHLGDDYLNDGQHPSSIPPSRTPSRRRQQQQTQSQQSQQQKRTDLSKGSNSSKLCAATAGKSKVDKSYNYNDRRSARNGPNGLRRRSLVLAAVTAVLEAENSVKFRDSMPGSLASDQLLHLVDNGLQRPIPQSSFT